MNLAIASELLDIESGDGFKIEIFSPGALAELYPTAQ